MKSSKQYLIPSFIIRIVFLGVLSLCLNNKVLAQTEMSKVNLYTSIGAVPGIEALVNIEYRIYSGEKITWYGKAGVGFEGILLLSGGPGYLGGITMLTGKGNNHFDLSGALFFGYDSYYEDNILLPNLDLGYRYQKPNGGFIFKAKVGFLGIGIGLGYAF